MTTFCYPYKRGTGWRSQGFRSGKGSVYNAPGGHTGFDQAMPAGTPIYAPGDGIIRNSGWLTDNYMANDWWLTKMGGDTLVIDCTDAFGRSETMPTFIIAHLQDSIAEVGQRVKKGQLIGISGNSGTATTGAHAHIEALPPNWDFNNGVYGRVDPELYFTEYPDDIHAGGAAIGPQGTTKEDTLSAAEVKEIKDHINAVLIGGYTWQGKKHPGGLMVVEEEQRRAAADRKNLPATIAAAVWATLVKRAGGNVSALQELADVKSKLLGIEPVIAQIQDQTDPAALADLIPDALAQQVIDALAARLAGGSSNG